MNIYLTYAIGILIPFLGTTLGSAVVFFFKKPVSDKLEKIFLGFAAGVMFAASVWSLIIPSIEMADSQGVIGWIPATVGISFGAIFLLITDIFGKKINPSTFDLPDKKKRTKILNFAITLHNIPEGMAVGIVFASALSR